MYQKKHLSDGMKSAIFQEQSPLIESRLPKKSAILAKGNKLASSASGLSLLNWNLDEMISLYTSTGSLPVRLSPKLPPQFETKAFDYHKNGDGVKDEDSAESDIDDTPMSLLSPTLPSIFTEHSRDTKHETKSGKKDHAIPSLAQPLPKKLTTVSSVLSGASPKSSRVRWINKVNHSEKPRFLMRITFKELLGKYKSTFGPKSPVNYHGLGIDIRPSPDLKGRDFWLKVAKDIQNRNDTISSRGSLLTVILQFDWLLCLVIANGQEENEKAHTRGSSAEHWYNLRNEIPHFVQRIEKFLRSNNVEEKKPYITFLVGILHIMKALILKRINSILNFTLDGYFDQKDPSPQIMNKVINLQKQIISNRQQADDYLAESQSFFIRCDSPSRIFPKSWESRKTSLQKTPLAAPSPAEDGYFLPLGSYSDLRECSAYLYSCIKEFLDLYEPEISGNVRYILQSGKKKG